MNFRLGFHLVIALIPVFVGAFSLLKTGSVMRHSATILPVFGIIVIWLLVVFVLWLSRRDPGTD